MITDVARALLSDFFHNSPAWAWAQTNFAELMTAIAQGMQPVNDAFAAVVDKWENRFLHSGRVVDLERFLNTEYSLAYDPGTRATDITTTSIIYIGSPNITINYLYFKSEGRPKRYLYLKSEGKPKWYLYFKSESGGGTPFVVNVPNTLTYDDAQLRSLIDLFKPAGTSYTIQTY